MTIKWSSAGLLLLTVILVVAGLIGLGGGTERAKDCTTEDKDSTNAQLQSLEQQQNDHFERLESKLLSALRSEIGALRQQEEKTSRETAAQSKLYEEALQSNEKLKEEMSALKKQQNKSHSISVSKSVANTSTAEPCELSKDETRDAEDIDRPTIAATLHPSWCPNATCKNSARCHPCQRRFLILLAEGRSGSTTLTYMMDSLPGIRMSGENSNTIGAMKKAVDGLMDIKEFRAGVRGAWGHNPIPHGSFACPVQHMIETINPPVFNDDNSNATDTDTILGFKTIRFLQNGPHDDGKTDANMVRFVQQHFPCTRILVNIRSNSASQARSQAKMGWRPASSIAKATESIAFLNERLVNISTMFGPDQAFLLDSSEWTKNISSLNAAVDWLGFDSHCHFKELLELNVPTRTKSEIKARERIALNSECTAL